MDEWEYTAASSHNHGTVLLGSHPTAQAVRDSYPASFKRGDLVVVRRHPATAWEVVAERRSSAGAS